MDYIKKMKKMEQLMQYVLDNIDFVSLEDLADHFHMNSAYLARIFREYYGIPFQQYLTSLRLRYAAQLIRETGQVSRAVSMAGYSRIQAFSNAFSREFGVSPRAFLKSNMAVPDMPGKKQIRGVPFDVTYRQVSAFEVKARAVRPEQGNHTDLLEAAAYALDHGQNADLFADGENRIGIWWFDEQGELFYAIGASGEDFPYEDCTIRIPEQWCVLFSMESGASPQESAARQRQLARYVFKEWQVVNRAPLNRMGITFEFFDANRIGICIPLLAGRESNKLIPPEQRKGEEWLDYIDTHIRENLTVGRVAEQFHYSEGIFRTTFFSRFGMAPSEYIQKRSLLQAAEEMEERGADLDHIAAAYGFRDYATFRGRFCRVFGAEPEQASEVRVPVLKLTSYYLQNRQHLRMISEYLEDFWIRGHRIGTEELYDLSSVACFYMRDTVFSCEWRKAAAAIWSEDNNGGYGYYVGTVETERSDLSKEEDSCQLIAVKGGKYIRFETENSSDDEEMTEAFTRLDRCAFHSWIRENRIRYDGKRLTFVRYTDGKLYFYIPVKR